MKSLLRKLYYDDSPPLSFRADLRLTLILIFRHFMFWLIIVLLFLIMLSVRGMPTGTNTP